jgi:1-deoxy-D-xylulose-5-phosphate reductoisomerase
MNVQKLLILGSTGSIGEQTLRIVDAHPERLHVGLLTANTNWRLLARQIRLYRPEFAVLADDSNRVEFLLEVGNIPETTVLFGADSILEAMRTFSSAVVINALVGFSGFLPSLEAVERGFTLCLANKESLVVGGEIIMPKVRAQGKAILPVDSEHSAIFQCLAGEPKERVEALILTASGGPFRNHTFEQIQNVTLEDALKHPNWSMGAKITIDSSTLMNKGLEIIEAYWLFDIDLERIKAVIHPQSIVHSMVEFSDGSIKAQLGWPDMRLPIQYALSYPDRWPLEHRKMNWSDTRLDFKEIDSTLFPCFTLARESIRAGGFAPAILNAANEVAVSKFLNREIGYIHIPKVIAFCLENVHVSGAVSVEQLLHADTLSRQKALEFKL